jgi:2-haloacid dehalogenase
MRGHLVFDLNGTLFDLAGLDPILQEFTGHDGFHHRWFNEVLKHMLVSATTTVYHSFEDITIAALQTVSTRAITPEDHLRLQEALTALPLFPDVEPAVRRFASDDRKLVAFTNGSLAGAEKQLSNAGISKYFTAIHSAEEIQRYKPSIEAYEFLAKKLGVGVSEIMLVAAHDWDIAGASWAGLQTAYIEREQPLSTITPTPTVIARDLMALADQLQLQRAA